MHVVLKKNPKRRINVLFHALRMNALSRTFYRPGRLFAILLAFWISSGGCAWQDQTDNSEDYNLLLLQLALFQDSSSGDCIQSHRTSTELGRLTCSRAARTQCAVDAKFDPNGNLIVTAEKRNRYVAEWNNLVDEYGQCTATLAVLLSNSVYRETSSTNYQTIRDNNVVQVIDNCETLNNSNITKLISENEYQFAITSRGLMARQAHILGETACFHAVTLTTAERDLIADLNSGSRLLETTCLYGTNALTNVCSATEKTNAHPFDFNTPL